MGTQPREAWKGLTPSTARRGRSRFESLRKSAQRRRLRPNAAGGREAASGRARAWLCAWFGAWGGTGAGAGLGQRGLGHRARWDVGTMGARFGERGWRAHVPLIHSF